MAKLSNFWDFETWQVDRRNQELLRDEERVGLEGREFEVLDFLICFHGQFHSRESIIENVWAPTESVGLNSADQAVAGIRRKLEILGLRDNQIIESKSRKGIRFLLTPIEPTVQFPVEGLRQLPNSVDRNIVNLLLRDDIERALRRVLIARDYPKLMTLSSEPVINPIWRLIPTVRRIELSTTFSPFGDLPPRIMHLDIFLLRANDKSGKPRLLTYYSGRPVSGWKAFLFPFRQRRPGETEAVRHDENAKDISNYFGIDKTSVHVSKLGEQFVVSVKPDPGYSELVAYVFEFCSVRCDIAPEWLRGVDCTLTLDKSAGRFRWFYPAEMEGEERSMLVNGDVIRGMHHFFGITLPAVPVGFPAIVE